MSLEPNLSWDEKARYYEERIKTIRVIETVSIDDLRRILSQIDEVLSEALFDLSEVQDDYERISSKVSTAMSEFLLEGKENKMTDEKAKNYAQVKVSECGFIDAKVDALRRLNFMKNVVLLLREKREMMVMEYGLIKIESGMAG